jgi:hypothetical protein
MRIGKLAYDTNFSEMRCFGVFPGEILVYFQIKDI